MNTSRIPKIAAILLICCCVVVIPPNAPAFTELIVFGDSLSDAGNIYALTSGLIPESPYWQGRFSNGPTWVEVLATQLGLADPAARWAASSNQTNYAVGGAKTDYTSFPVIGAVGMDAQVVWFQTDLTNQPGWAVSDALFVVWGGGNDYFNYLDSGGPLPTPALNLRQRIETLISLGAQTFLTCNLPPLGETPSYRGTPKQDEANQLSAQFAADWQQQVNELSVLHPECVFYYFDVHTAFQDIVANPENYGLVNVTDPAFDGSTVASNADEFLFWDTVHPTRAGHMLIGQQAANLVPEPNSALLLLLAAPLLLRRRLSAMFAKA